MADDVFSAYGKGFVGFAHTRAAHLVGDSFSDTGKLILSLGDGQTGTTKAAFDALKADIDQLTAIGKDIAKAIDKEINDAKAAVQEMAAELGASPFEVDEAMRAMTALVKLLIAYDNALTKVAEEIAKKANDGRTPEQIKDAIAGMNAPIKKALNSAGGAVAGEFDKLCKLLLNIDNAAAGLGDKLVWNYAEKRLHVDLVAVGSASLPPVNFDGASLRAFFTYKTEVKAGLEIKTKLKAGLRGDKMMDKIMPGQPPTADTDQVAITLDTKDGLTFGSGPNKRLVLPVRFSWPGIELREFALEQPAQDNDATKNRVNIVVTVAGKLGETFACVVEGGGISIRWVPGGAPDVAPKIPSGAGLRLKTSVVTGGGYLRYDEVKKEYGGSMQLQLAKIGIYAVGVLGVDPFNMVIVIGVRFSPGIQLGYGFQLSGLGGILAIERTLDSAALRDGLKDGVVGQLLFPEDPVAAAPQILNSLGKIFPPRAGGFVVGPIAELAWGPPGMRMIAARLGIVLALPDPKVVLLGAVQIGVPNVDVEPKLRVVDIRAELMGEINPDFFFLKVSLAGSKIMKLEISGDIALFIKWSDEGAFALSVGGFFPGYDAPKEIGDMRRVGIRMAPPVPWLSLSIEAYVAITSNSVQFGGKVSLLATLGPAKAEGWLALDAMFRWAPTFYFVVRVDAGIKVSAFGVTLAGVTFKGEISGDKPFRLEGHAAVEILWWDVPVDIGPLEWGEKPPAPAQQSNPLTIAAEAFKTDEAWTPLLPPEVQAMVRLDPPDAVRLYHPCGRIEARQIAVPFETDMDRIGQGKVTSRRVNLREARLGGQPAAAVWPLKDRFAAGHFLDLKDHEVLARPPYEEHVSGLGMGAARGAAFSTAVHAATAWDTICPAEPDRGGLTGVWNIPTARAAAILAAAAKTTVQAANPYLAGGPRPNETPVDLTERGMVRLVSAETLTPAAFGDVLMPASAAGLAMQEAALAGESLTTLAAGFR